MSNYSDFVPAGGAVEIGTVSTGKLAAEDGVWLDCDGTTASEASYPELAQMMRDAKVHNGYDFDRTSEVISSTEGSTKLLFSPDGKYLVYNDNLLSVGDWSLVTTLSLTGSPYMFSPDGRHLVTYFYTTVYFYNTNDWSLDGSATVADQIWAIDYTSDGRYVFIGHNGSPYLTMLDSIDRSTVSGTPVPPALVRTLSYNATNNWLAVGYNDTGVGVFTVVYSVADWSTVQTIEHVAGVGVSKFTPNGAYLFLYTGVNANFQVDIVDTSTWGVVSSQPSWVPRSTSGNFSIAFTSDSQYAIHVRDSFGLMYILRLSDFTDVNTVQSLQYEDGLSVAVSPNDEYIVTSSRDYGVSDGVQAIPAAYYGPAGSFYLPTLSTVALGDVTVQPKIKASK